MTTIKNITHPFVVLRSLGLLVALTLSGVTPTLAQGQNQDMVQQKLRELQGKLQVLNSEIYEVQNEANRSPEVQQALLNYSEVLTEEMKKIDPENQSLIDQRQAAYKQILKVNFGEMTPEKESQLQEIGQEFNSIRRQLGETEAQANRTERASSALNEYNEVVMARMAEMNPGIQEKIEQREAISREFTNLRNAIMQNQ